MIAKLLLAVLVVQGLMIPAQTKYCEGGPLPRLEVGGRGEVAPGVDRLWLRALPAVGTGEVRLLYAGNQFEVLAGPSCNGGYSWWRVQLDDSTTGWVAEGIWEVYYLRPLIGDDARTICNSAQTPWLYLLATVACSIVEAVTTAA